MNLLTTSKSSNTLQSSIGTAFGAGQTLEQEQDQDQKQKQDQNQDQNHDEDWFESACLRHENRKLVSYYQKIGFSVVNEYGEDWTVMAAQVKDVFARCIRLQD